LARQKRQTAKRRESPPTAPSTAADEEGKAPSPLSSRAFSSSEGKAKVKGERRAEGESQGETRQLRRELYSDNISAKWTIADEKKLAPSSKEDTSIESSDICVAVEKCHERPWRAWEGRRMSLLRQQ